METLYITAILVAIITTYHLATLKSRGGVFFVVFAVVAYWRCPDHLILPFLFLVGLAVVALVVLVSLPYWRRGSVARDDFAMIQGFTREKFAELQGVMTRKQVEAILGEKNDDESRGADGVCVTWGRDEEAQISITFIDDVVFRMTFTDAKETLTGTMSRKTSKAVSTHFSAANRQR